MDAEHQSPLRFIQLLQTVPQSDLFGRPPRRPVPRRVGQLFDHSFTKHQPIPGPITLMAQDLEPSDHASPTNEFVPTVDTRRIAAGPSLEVIKFPPTFKRRILHDVLPPIRRGQQRSNEPSNRRLMPSQQPNEPVVLLVACGQGEDSSGGK